MIRDETRTIFDSAAEWDAYWNASRVGRAVKNVGAFRDVAHYVGGALFTQGFQLFENGGMPLIERHTGPFREEILFAPAPKMHRRPEVPFGVRIHLSSSEVARVRSRYWRPAIRAPHVVASGDIGRFEAPHRRIVWYASGELETARQLIDQIMGTVLPWFRCFGEPQRMRERLYAGTLAWIDDCTALELLLAEFDPFEARRYLRRMTHRSLRYDEPGGYELSGERVGPIRAYYRL